MINYINGKTIFDSDADCIVNPVNCVGVMGKGLALEFKRRHPDMFHTYKSLCANDSLTIGRVGFYIEKPKGTGPIICLFPTKHHWQNPSTVDIINQSLEGFCKYAPELNIKNAAFPKVGCGLGGLSFDHQVKPLLDQFFAENSPFTITVYT